MSGSSTTGADSSTRSTSTTSSPPNTSSETRSGSSSSSRQSGSTASAAEPSKTSTASNGIVYLVDASTTHILSTLATTNSGSNASPTSPTAGQSSSGSTSGTHTSSLSTSRSSTLATSPSPSHTTPETQPSYSTPSTDPRSDDGSGSHSKLGGGAVAGIIIGSVAVIIGILLFWKRRRVRRQLMQFTSWKQTPQNDPRIYEAVRMQEPLASDRKDVLPRGDERNGARREKPEGSEPAARTPEVAEFGGGGKRVGLGVLVPFTDAAEVERTGADSRRSLQAGRDSGTSIKGAVNV